MDANTIASRHHSCSELLLLEYLYRIQFRSGETRDLVAQSSTSNREQLEVGSKEEEIMHLMSSTSSTSIKTGHQHPHIVKRPASGMPENHLIMPTINRCSASTVHRPSLHGGMAMPRSCISQAHLFTHCGAAKQSGHEKFSCMPDSSISPLGAYLSRRRPRLTCQNTKYALTSYLSVCSISLPTSMSSHDLCDLHIHL